MSAFRPSGRVPTRALLVCGALAALQTLLIVTLSPATTVLATLAPPVYAVAAGCYGVLPVLARLTLRLPGTATITSVLAGLLASVFTPLGLLAIVPLALGSAVFDIVLSWRPARPSPPLSRRRLLLAGSLSGAVLFVVSLPVFSADHLTLAVLIMTLLGRLAGQMGAALVASLLERALDRAGVLRASRR